MMRARSFATGLTALVAGMVLATSAADAADGPRIDVLSTRADLVTDGQALVAIDLPTGTAPSAVSVALDGSDVTGQFATRSNGRFEGLLSGLRAGANDVTASVRGGPSASQRIVNHPTGGPLFSGPQLKPWPCQEGALDAQCNKPTAYAFQYM